MLVITSVTYIAAPLASAQEAQFQAITISPSSTDLTVEPGSSTDKSLDVINSSSDAFTVDVVTSPYYVRGEDYDPQFTQLPGTVDASKWVRIPQTQYTIDGGKKTTLSYTVVIPKDTQPGGYYAVIFVQTDTENDKTGVVSHNRVGNILYITVSGDIKTGGTLTGNRIPAVSYIGSIPIGTKVSNTGGSHFITNAKYSIKNMFNKTIFSANIERYVLPQTQRDITTPWSPQSLFGIFTVHRSATIDGKEQTLPDERIIIINPWVFVLLTFIIGILVGIPVERARRRRQLKK